MNFVLFPMLASMSAAAGGNVRIGLEGSLICGAVLGSSKTIDGLGAELFGCCSIPLRGPALAQRIARLWPK